jgi:hypothetical protein
MTPQYKDSIAWGSGEEGLALTERIKRAMKKTGYTSLAKFVRDAVEDKLRRLGI